MDTGLEAACGAICGLRGLKTLRVLPSVQEPDGKVPGLDLWYVPRSSPTRERKLGLGDGKGGGLTIAGGDLNPLRIVYQAIHVADNVPRCVQELNADNTC